MLLHIRVSKTGSNISRNLQCTTHPSTSMSFGALRMRWLHCSCNNLRANEAGKLQGVGVTEGRSGWKFWKVSSFFPVVLYPPAESLCAAAALLSVYVPMSFMHEDSLPPSVAVNPEGDVVAAVAVRFEFKRFWRMAHSVRISLFWTGPGGLTFTT